MCKIMIKNSQENKDFIIYNHLFLKDDYKFTVPQLVEELRQYNLDLSQETVQSEVNAFARSGLIKQNFKSYSTCSR